mgnify:CR=1 FL=1
MRHTRIIAIANQKGGVGKTTTCVNLGAALVESGRKVLLLDNDPQANLTSYLSRGSASESSQKSTLDELYLAKRVPDRDEAEARFLRRYSAGFEYIAADGELSAVENYLYAKPERETILKRALAWADGAYDFIFIDNPPSVNLLTLNALAAAHEVLVPLQTEFFSVEGITKIQDTIRLVRERWNPTLLVGGLVATQVDYRKKLTHDVLATLAQHYPEALLKTRIRDNSKLGESSGHGKTIFRYAPSSPGAEDYRSLADEILSRPRADGLI